MKIDICIPVCKPDRKLYMLLDRLATQTVKPDKIIIMYTKLSSDDCLAKEYMDAANKVCTLEIHELMAAEFDHGKTRADGIGYSSADIVICMTMDAVPYDNNLIEELVSRIGKDGVAAAYARQMPDSNSSLAECFTRGFNYPETELIKSREDLEKLGIKTFFCSNVCAAYDRSIYNSLGGFVERTIFNEDMIYAHKVIMNGYKIHYSAKAKVIHTHDYTAMQQFHRNFDLAVSQVMYKEVFEGVSSESEGKKYIKSAFRYFKEKSKGYLIIPFVYGCCFKYLGYLLGKRYEKLPGWFVKYCAMNKNFFEVK